MVGSDIRGGRIRTDGPSSSLNTTEPGRPPHNSSVAIETGLLFNAVAVIVGRPVKSHSTDFSFTSREPGAREHPDSGLGAGCSLLFQPVHTGPTTFVGMFVGVCLSWMRFTCV